MINSKTHGGLGNRLKNIVSCMKLSDEYGLPINIQWGKKPFVCNCNFDDLYENDFSINNLSNIKINYPFNPFACWRLYVSDKDNIPNNFTKIKKDIGGDTLSGAINYTRFIDMEYNRIPDSLKNQYINYFNSLKLKKEIREKIKSFSSKYFNAKTISVHIRSWPVKSWELDIKRSKKVKLEKFINEMKKYENYNFFLATDSDEVKKIMKEHFKNKIFTYNRKNNLCDKNGNQINRNTIEGIQDDLVELYLLSKNNIIIGSHSSSFTEVAWYLGGCTKNITIL
jgi:hypothetical protein